MKEKKKYFVREDTKNRLKKEYRDKYDKGELTDQQLHDKRNEYYEKYRDFSVDTYNEHGIMYTVEKGFKTFEEAKSFGLKHREENQ